MKSIFFSFCLMLIVPHFVMCQSEIIKNNNDQERVFKSSNDYESDNIRRADNPKKKGEQSEKSDSTELSKITKKLADAIEASDQAVVHKLESYITKDSMAEYLRDYQILETAQLSKAQFDQIKALILSPETYENGDYQKLCLFLPRMGIVFQQDEQAIEVLITFDCDVTRVYFEDQYLSLNSDPGHEALLSFYKSTFPVEQKKNPENVPMFYTVETGDGWRGIADKASNTYKMDITMDDILNWNKKKKKDIIHPGDKIIVGYTE